MMTVPRMLPLPAAWPYAPRAQLAPWVVREGLDLGPFGSGWTVLSAPAFTLEGEVQAMDGAFGRGGVVRAGEVVARPYRRGGMLRHVNAAAYGSSSRFQSEALIHRFLWESGLPTVQPLGCAWRPKGLGVEGIYFTRWRDARPWPRHFEEGAWPQIQALIQALSTLGCWVPDLNATNLLLDQAGEVLVLDFDRARFTGGDLRRAYWRRLSRSLRKLQAPASLLARVEAV